MKLESCRTFFHLIIASANVVVLCVALIMNKTFNVVHLTRSLNLKQSLIFRKDIMFVTILVIMQGLQAVAQASSVNRVEIKMSDAQLNQILSSDRYEVDSSEVKIFANGQLMGRSQVELQNRGQTSLKKFKRKNLTLKMMYKTDGSEEKHAKFNIGSIRSKKIILSAGPEDGLLLKNRLSYSLLNHVGVTALQSDYAELILNGQSQGLYMVTDNPSDFVIKSKDADVVFRRRYNDDIEFKDSKKDLTDHEIKAAHQQLSLLHKKLTSLSGADFVREISKHFNLQNYMKWMALNYLLKNGDFVDEVYFFGKKQDSGTMYFDIVPWDLDDIFAEQMHLAQVPTFPNNAMADESNKQLIFNYEGRIDLAIARDPVLLEMYFQVMTEVVDQLDDIALEALFAQINDDVKPYLTNNDIVKAGLKDAEKVIYDESYVKQSLNEKLKILRERRDFVKSELNKIYQDTLENRKLRLNAFQLFFIQLNNYLLRYFTK